MKLQNRSKVIALSLIASLVSSSVLASGGHSGGKKGERRGPPPAAIEACASSSLDQACSFTSKRHGEVSGMCVLRKDDDSQLACKPDRGSRKGKGKHKSDENADQE